MSNGFNRMNVGIWIEDCLIEGEANWRNWRQRDKIQCVALGTFISNERLKREEGERRMRRVRRERRMRRDRREKRERRQNAISTTMKLLIPIHNVTLFSTRYSPLLLYPFDIHEHCRWSKRRGSTDECRRQDIIISSDWTFTFTRHIVGWKWAHNVPRYWKRGKKKSEREIKKTSNRQAVLIFCRLLFASIRFFLFGLIHSIHAIRSQRLAAVFVSSSKNSFSNRLRISFERLIFIEFSCVLTKSSHILVAKAGAEAKTENRNWFRTK